jgi:hypothetical protein
MPFAMGDDLPNAVGKTEETADLATPENIPLAPESVSKKRLRFGAAVFARSYRRDRCRHVGDRDSARRSRR